MAFWSRLFIVVVIVFQASTSIAFARSATGTVVYIASGCDYFIVEANGHDYALLEWYGGYTPSTGDQIAGEFEAYGFANVVNVRSGRTTRVWVEDYGLSRESVIEMYTEMCGRPPVRQSSQTTSPSSVRASPNVIQSNIRGDFEGWEGDTVFLLDNGQVWQQASYSYHYHYAYQPRVTIVQTARGYVMQVEGVSEVVYVRRIR